jgi:hypothetical protein
MQYFSVFVKILPGPQINMNPFMTGETTIEID